MPKRTDLRSILVLGSGPIVIGQACEFDYSGTQACRALKREGYRVVLVNSNPATIMTDPEFADATYIEPLDVATVAKIIERERPDALLPTLGGQTALNLAVAVAEDGTLDRFGVELIGAKIPAIKKAEDRELFKHAMERIGLALPRSGFAKSFDEARTIVRHTGYPALIRPSFTLGGTGGGIAFNVDDFERLVKRGLTLSPVHEILVEESVLGWKEFELEVMRDHADTCVVVCSIENVDPMGVHTGDSITVAPQMTLSDVEYQAMRDDAKKVIRAVGVATGGSNIQFAVHPETGRRIVIEMNPRVSRSSALASKATGFPIAKIAAYLAVGYLLDEIPNDITKKTPASFEPTLDYVVVKIPRFNFEKFPGASTTLGVSMKSVGEVMALGRTFAEAFGKALRSLETGRTGWLSAEDLAPLASEGEHPRRGRSAPKPDALRVPRPERIFSVLAALRAGTSPVSIAEATGIDRWFLDRFVEVIEVERDLVDLRRGPRAPPRHRRRRRRGPPPGGRRPAGLPARRHVRGGVRVDDALPLLLLRARGRGGADVAEEDRGPRLGPEPDRAGARVRLLLRPRGRGDLRGRARVGDDQLQPRDGLDGLRHVRPPLLRAAHVRGRDGRDREGAAGGRPRPVRRADAAEARAPARARGRQDPRDLARSDRPRRGPRAFRRAPA